MGLEDLIQPVFQKIKTKKRLVGPRHYSIGIILGSGRTLHILQEAGARWWVLRFNGTQTIFNWSMILGKLVESSYLTFIFLTLMLSILNREALYGKTIVFAAYIGFMTFFLVCV